MPRRERQRRRSRRGPGARRRHEPHEPGARATNNPDGVVFYKIWNGRSSPKMPTLLRGALQGTGLGRSSPTCRRSAPSNRVCSDPCPIRFRNSASASSRSLVIAATPAAVFDCFFSADALRAWWQAVRSVTTPVPFGVYAVEWATTPLSRRPAGPARRRLSRHGGRRHVPADSFSSPTPAGSRRKAIRSVRWRSRSLSSPTRHGCRLHVRQDGYEPSPRWRRYYAVVSRGWQISLTALKRYAETPPAPEAR